MRDSSINNSNLDGSLAKPGAKIYTTSGIRNSNIKIITNKIKKRIEKTSEANCNAFFLFSCFKIDENIGIKAAAKAPSANILLKKLGNLKETKKTSATKPAPTSAAIKISLINPRILLINVSPLTVIKDLSNFINNLKQKKLVSQKR